MKTKTWLALTAVLAVLALAALAAGCGSDDERTSPSGNAADAAFIADMTTHHRSAVEMARIAQRRAEHPEIRQLAGDVVNAQEGEISVMEIIRDDMRNMGEQGDDHMGMSDSEMGMDLEPAMLDDAKPFDRAFIDMMVPHHRGAIAMAKQQLAQGSQPGLRKIAQDIIDAQTTEIGQMRKWRKAWYGSDDSTHGTDDSMQSDG